MLDRIWFGISDLYAIKRYMHLSGMRLTDFVCIAKNYVLVIQQIPVLLTKIG